MDVRRKERKRGEKTPRCSSHLCISLSPATPFLRSCYGRSSRESFPTYICSSTIPFLSSPLLFTTLVPLRSRFSCRQLDLQSNRESRDPRLPGMKGEGGREGGKFLLRRRGETRRNRGSGEQLWFRKGGEGFIFLFSREGISNEGAEFDKFYFSTGRFVDRTGEWTIRNSKKMKRFCVKLIDSRINNSGDQKYLIIFIDVYGCSFPSFI